MSNLPSQDRELRNGPVICATNGISLETLNPLLKISRDRVTAFIQIPMLFAAIIGLLGCGFLEITSQPRNTTVPITSDPTEVMGPASTPTLSTLPSPVVVPDTGWENIRPGLERRIINWAATEESASERFYLLRIDPTSYRFDVAYRPGAPQSMTDWQKETGALIVVNGGFFTEANEATGLIIVDGQASGTSYEDFGGMLAIDSSGPDLRWLPMQPYNPAEPLSAGLQSFPMLVKPNGIRGYPDEDGQPARRTVIAKDGSGRIMFVLAASGTLTLHQMSQFLVETDLDVRTALNLDGGASSGLLLAEPMDGIAPFTLLPVVITVYEK